MRRHCLLASFLLLLSSLTWAQDLFDPNLTPEGVRAALDAGADLEARDEWGVTPLMSAARNDYNREVVQVLLDAGADLEARDEDGQTPLLYATWWGSKPEMVQALLYAGADVNARTEDGSTPLMSAARNSYNPAVVQVLLDAGADPSIQDNEGKMAWDHIQENDALKDTDAYSELKDRSSDE